MAVRRVRAVGVQAALAGARETGAGELIDLSMLEVAVLCLTYYPVTFFETLGRPWRTERSLSQPGVAAAKDGLVASGAAPHSSGSTCAPWWATRSGSTRTRRCDRRAGQRAVRQLREWVADRTVDGDPGPRHGLPHPQRAGQQRRDRHRA